jgi:hypothetical protein
MNLPHKVVQEMALKSRERAYLMQAVHIIENNPTSRLQWRASEFVANQWELELQKLELTAN